LVVVFITTGFTVSKRIETMIKKEITKVFNIETFTKETITIEAEVNETLPVKISDTNFFKIINENKTIGYYFLGHAYGKADYFDFIVIFDKDLIVSKIKVLVYREDHGGEVGSKRWLKQFIGITTDTELKYQDNIIGISGATISVESMTNEVNNILKTVHKLNTKNLL